MAAVFMPGTVLGEQMDMLTKNKKSFVSLNGTVMEDDGNNLTVQPFQLDYREFEGNHSGEVIHE